MTNQQTRTEKPDEPPKVNWEPIRKNSFIHLVEIILAIALVVIAYLQYTVYARQAGIMDNQAGIMDKQTAISSIANELNAAGLRPYIGFRELKFSDPGSQPSNVSIPAVITNGGNTAAYNVIIDRTCDTDSSFKHMVSFPKIRTTVGPHLDLSFQACIFKTTDFRIWRDAKSHLYFLGLIRYDDEPTIKSGHAYKTAYCLDASNLTGNPESNIKATITTCDPAQTKYASCNCADIQCESCPAPPIDEWGK